MTQFRFNRRDDPPTITSILQQAFGITFLHATTDQKLALIECTAFLMRQNDYCLREAIIVTIPNVTMPPAVAFCDLKLQNPKEGLTLLALLYGGVNRDCVVVEDE